MFTWLHSEQKRFTEDEQCSGLNEKYFLETTQRFMKGIYFVVQSKRNERKKLCGETTRHRSIALKITVITALVIDKHT